MNIKDNMKTVYRWLFRKKNSYSQTGEDIILNIFFAGQKKGFYVDIGANDPMYTNNTYFFYKKGWSGILIEPNAKKCNILRKIRRRDIVINAGIGIKTSEMDFYIFDPDTISTFSAEEANQYQSLGHKLVKTAKVRLLPLREILAKQNVSSIDVLSIDTEGFEMEVLRSNNWQIFRPKSVIIEISEYKKDSTKRSNKPVDEFMDSIGYVKIADTYINGIYFEREFAVSKGLENIYVK